MRSTKLRAQSGPEPRSGRSCQLQEGQCVSRTPPTPCIAHTDLFASPRESAIEIVHLINSRNQNVALLALAVCSELGEDNLARGY